MNIKACLIALPAVLACFAALPSDARPIPATGESAVTYHPHFKKVLECKVSRDLTLTIRYQTVTFDAEGAKKLKPGGSWHLAGATIETSSEVIIGGEKIAPGKYALSVKKAEAKTWILTLHKGRGFSKPAADAHELKTRFLSDAPMFEHMNIDVQPAGDKKNTKLHLDVRFDKLMASATIEVPHKEK